MTLHSSFALYKSLKVESLGLSPKCLKIKRCFFIFEVRSCFRSVNCSHSLKGLEVCDGIDLNLGCPQTKAQINCYGAFLMKKPEIVRSMITALCRECTLPICAKIRILPTFTKTVAFTDMLIESGISMLVVHGRRREKKYHRLPADLKIIRKIKEHYYDHHGLRIPIISNGNILTQKEAEQNLKMTKCDGVMSAYGLLRNPFLFDFKTSQRDHEPARHEYLDFVAEYGLHSCYQANISYHLNKFGKSAKNCFW